MEISQIEQTIKDLIKIVFGVDVSLTPKQTLKGLEIVVDCPQEYKGKILGKKGRTIKVLKRLVRVMGKYQFNANILLFLKPDGKEQS